MADNEQLLPTRMLCERYNVVSRTIDRWTETQILPPPLWINKQRYWRLSDLEKFERDGMRTRKPNAA